MQNNEPVFKFTGRIEWRLLAIGLGLLTCGSVNTILAVSYGQAYQEWLGVSVLLYTASLLYIGLAVLLNPDRFEDRLQ